MRRADRITEHGERPFCRNPRIELAERSRRCVPGIGEGRLSLCLATAVQVAEGLPFHAHLPPDLDPLRNDRHGGPDGCVFIPAGDDEGNSGYRPEVQCDILTHGTVSPRGSDHKDASFVNEVDGQAVQLGFHDVADGLIAPQETPAPSVEFPDLLGGEGVGQTEHGGQVCDWGEFLQGGRPDPLCGGVRRRQ